MTSSERNLKFGQPKWDYNIQEYKASRDVFCEKGLFSILFLACGRHDITRRCLLSTVDAVTNYSKPVEWILLDNGGDDQNYQLFQDLKLERKVIIRQSNFGINEAINQMWSISRGEWCLIHENDWENRLPSFNLLDVANNIFEEKQDVGIIQLRAIWDPCENWGINKPMYNPWSCSKDQNTESGVKMWNEKTHLGHEYLIGKNFYGFNNNPIIISKRLYRECGPYPECEVGSDPRHGETLYQDEVLKTDCSVAHIGREVYYHVGKVQTKGV